MAKPGFPDLPPDLQKGIWQQWWVSFRTYLLTNFFTQSDITILMKGKGIVMTNAAGTVTKRVRLNNAGNGFIFENV